MCPAVIPVCAIRQLIPPSFDADSKVSFDGAG
jgi:hypothetical protein